ncbi:hypothetical protein EVAR_43795_1 [Eumeta japonica]|uniref:Uncharacterized protein n=1 Tax=Eumeta variegata TaxID=151549 RepID=A0A4C1XXA4_EUMVA|nr:hypothetical protein EVAR_43795_1 [Eumeta japonica]
MFVGLVTRRPVTRGVTGGAGARPPALLVPVSTSMKRLAQSNELIVLALRLTLRMTVLGFKIGAHQMEVLYGGAVVGAGGRPPRPRAPAADGPNR